MKKKNCIIFLWGMVFSLNAFGQGYAVLPSVIDKGDTIPFARLPEYHFHYNRFASEKDKKEWQKLVYNVRKVYPYAKLAGVKMKQYDQMILKSKNEKQRRNLMKKAEKEVKDNFEKELKNLTISQGRVLIKLIYRETGNSSYILIKELRGAFRAFIYQGIARLFGHNLKSVYDPKINPTDASIEYIMWMLENGYWQPIPMIK